MSFSNQYLSKVTELQDSKCPLCSKPLASNEYEKAITELENKLRSNFEKEHKKHQNDFEKQRKELEVDHTEELKRLKVNSDNQLESIQKQLEDSKKEKSTI